MHMGTRYTRFAQWRKSVFEHTTPGIWISIALVILAIAGGIFWAATRPEPDPINDPVFDRVRERGAIRVGVRTDIPNFATQVERADGTVDWTGLETDIAREMANAIFGDPEAVDFVPVDFTTRHIKLKAGLVDVLIALSPQGYSSSFLYSEPYYTDAVVAIVLKDGPQSLTGLQGAYVGAITRPSGVSETTLANQGAMTVLQTYTREHQAEIQTVAYSDAPDMFEALERERILGLAMESALLGRYFNEEKMKALPTALGALPYSVVALPGNDAYVAFASQLFAAMRADGRMARLYQRYNLTDYATVAQTP